MLQDLPRPFVFAICLVSLSLCGWLWFANFLGLFSQQLGAGAVVAGLSIFDLHAAELTAVLLAGIWLMNGGPVARAAGYLLGALFLSIVAVQVLSLAQGNSYLPRVAIDNIESIHLILNASMITKLIVFTGVLAALGIWIEWRFQRKASGRSLWTASAVLLALLLASLSATTLLPDGIQARRQALLFARHLSHTAPTLELIRVLYQPDPLLREWPKWREDIEVAKSFGFSYNPDSDFPLVKREIYRGNPPFPTIAGKTKQPDIIVFFTEGLSARTINVYNGEKFPGLTPHIDQFSERSMRVTKYFSHTAATYRGLKGQLCSLFPYHGGHGGGGWMESQTMDKLMKLSYFCLNHLLSEHGYRNVFIDGNTSFRVDDMMRALNFDEVLQAGDMTAAFLGGVEPLHHHHMSNVQMMDALVKMLERRSPADGKRPPIFTALYPKETHSYMDIGEDGKSFGNGDNHTLNTIHTLDYAFGRFLQYFMNSRHAESTIVIFTADHAHYSEPSFVAIAGDDYKPVFADRIPLIIYDPTRELPRLFDAHHRSSVNFAPSLAHYLGLRNRPNPFMGRSIYEPNARLRGKGVGAIGDAYFLYDANGIHVHGTHPTKESEALARFLGHIYKVELENRIWPGNFLPSD